MRVFIAVLVLIFSLQSWTKADDIRDFQIEGISIGDSLLDHFSESKIKKQLSKTSSTYSDNKFKRVWIPIENYKTYKQMNFHYKNDASYRIVNLSGNIIYRKNFSECSKKQKEIADDIQNIFPNLKMSMSDRTHRADKTGNSKVKYISFKLKKGNILISCTDWGNQITKEKKWIDNLSVRFDTSEYRDWLKNKAYK